MTERSQKTARIQALAYAWEFGYTIAVPLVLLSIGGKFLDRWLHTAPWLFLTGILVAIIFSSIAVVMKALRIFREAEGRDNTNPPNIPPDNTPHA